MVALPHPVQSTALARPDHWVCVADDASLTARQLRDCVAQRAQLLAVRWGVRPGMRVALWGPAAADWVVWWHALGWLGAVVVPLASRATALEWRAAFELTRPTLLLITTGAGAAPRALLENEVRAAGVTVLAAESLVNDGGAALGQEAPERFWPLEEQRVVVLTSASTGAAKAVELTTAQLFFSAMGSLLRLGHVTADRWLLCLPLHHVGGLGVLMRAAWAGTTCVVHPGFDAARVAAALDSGEVTLVSLVPQMLERVLQARPHNRPFPMALRAVLLGGGPTPAPLLARCAELGVPVARTWGMSETASQVATTAPGDCALESGCGAPLAFARVGAQEGSHALWVTGPLAPEGVAGAAMAPGAGWLTADVGRVDERGWVHVTGRSDDILVSGGENIAPVEIEEVLRSHQGVADVAVVGVADATWGARPVAVLVAAMGASGAAAARPSDAALLAWCRERLSPFKVPKTFVWVEALPRNVLGKLSRPALRQQLASLLELPDP